VTSLWARFNQTGNEFASLLTELGNLLHHHADDQAAGQAPAGNSTSAAPRHALGEDRGNYAEAQTEYQAVLEIRRRILGEEHPDTLATQHNLAGAYLKMGRRRAAEAELKAVLATQERNLGASHPHTRATRNYLKSITLSRSINNQPVLWHGPGKRKKKRN
jgi:tetratricopeptide (TPR) repeat protein